MSSDESRLSTIQKMCINTIKMGAITAFIDVFRLTHMEQPMGKNQPTTFNDLVSTSGPTVPEILSKFTFDNPLNFNQPKLLTVQSLLIAADSCQMNEDYFGRFNALSKLVDIFFETQLMRTQLRMLPLVTPYPIVTSLNEKNEIVNCADIVSLIKSPLFARQVELRDPLLAAVAQIKSVETTTHVYCPLDVYYGIFARNTLYDMVQSLENSNSIAGLLHGVLPPLNPGTKVQSSVTPSDPATIPKNMKTRILLYVIICYLRLGKCLHFFQLYRAAHSVLDVCLVAIAALEQHLDVDFGAVFEPTTENSYKVLIPDDVTQVQTGDIGETTTFASARLDLNSVPMMPFTRLEEEALPTSFSDDPNECYASYIEPLAEFVFVARMMMAHNLMSLACTIFSNMTNEDDLMFVRADAIALHTKITQLKQQRPDGGQQSVEATLSVSSLADPTALPPDIVLPNMSCSYISALSGCVLLMNAADIAFGFNIYPMKLPICRRLFELVTRLNCIDIANPYVDKLLASDMEFAIHGHSWAANWAAARGDNEGLVHHLMARWKLANQELANTADILSELKMKFGNDLLGILHGMDNQAEKPSSQPSEPQTQKSRVRFDLASALSSARSASGSVDPAKHATNLDSIEDSVAMNTVGQGGAGFDLLDNLCASILDPEEFVVAGSGAKIDIKEAVAIPMQIDDVLSTPNTPNANVFPQTDSEIRAYESAQKLLRSAGVPSVGRDMGSSGLLETTRAKSNSKMEKMEKIRCDIARARAMVGAREAVAAASALSCVGNSKKDIKGSPINDLELMTGAWNTIAGIYVANEDDRDGTHDDTLSASLPGLASTYMGGSPTLAASMTGTAAGGGTLGKRSGTESMEKMIAEERRGVSTSVVEARVRLGAVKGQLLVQQTLGNLARRTIEEADESDMNLVLNECT